MFDSKELTQNELDNLKELSRLAKGDIITMTHLAGSGHPGGSMSSLDMYLTLFSCARLTGKDRDRIVVSHGHTSPGVYASLARLGYLPVDEVIAFFRKAGSPFEGHVVKGIPFIDWSTGNLGQGLSAGCGFAISSKRKKDGAHVYVLMGDGEQQKGQIGEARRFAKKYGLSNITAVVDYNGLQISGAIDCVMPQNIIENYLSDGWEVIDIDGHDYQEIYKALKRARDAENPVCIVARTVMGKGIPFMENKEKYHGSPLNDAECKDGMCVIGADDKLDFYKEKRKGMWTWQPSNDASTTKIDAGAPFTYGDEDKIDNRTAFGKALKDLGDKNIGRGQAVCVFDCDLASSVKTGDFAKAYPEYFYQGGIQEHNTATAAGALSTTGALTFFADFGVFGIDETYNQERLNDINRTNLKVILTHVGLDVGPDGKTHQCVDYVGLTRNLYHFKTIVPADANQTDRAVRYAAATEGNFLVAMGRNRWPVVYSKDGQKFFGEGYAFEYGKMDVLKAGKDGAIITYGAMVHRALNVRQNLAAKGLDFAIVNMACVNEIDEKVMAGLANLSCVITYEDHNRLTGIAPVITNYLVRKGFKGKFDSFGASTYGASGETEEVMQTQGLDADSMTASILKMMK
ncbi:MAG TPA: transketolase [Syntrophorhabdaceae bacterium]|nr:transketolase [Syntrophorhabdaceae bacterium]